MAANTKLFHLKGNGLEIIQTQLTDKIKLVSVSFYTANLIVIFFREPFIFKHNVQAVN